METVKVFDFRKIGITSYDLFLSAYRAAIIFAEREDGDTREADISEEFKDVTRDDCTLFFQRNIDLLLDAVEVDGYDWDDAGRDFWFTRKGHGAGFWDGDLPDELGDTLTERAKEFEEQWPYIGDDCLWYV